MPNNNIIPNNKFILIKGDESKWYEHIIFIAKNNTVKVPIDFVAEAEKIVDNYFAKHNTQQSTPYSYSAQLPHSLTARKKASKKNFDIFLYAIMLTGCVALAIIFLLSIK